MKYYVVTGVDNTTMESEGLAVAKTLDVALSWARDYLMSVVLDRYVHTDKESARIEIDRPGKSDRFYMILYWTRDAFGDPEYKDSYMVYIDPVDFVA